MNKFRHTFDKIAFHHALAISVIFFLVLQFATALLFPRYLNGISSELVKNTTEGLDSQLNHLVTEGNRVAQAPRIIGAIVSGDAFTTLGELNEEVSQRKLSSIIATDKDGVVIARTDAVSRRGDNIFINTSYGRYLSAQNKSVATFETGANDPHTIFIVSGRYVYNNNERIGTVITRQALNDEFATSFKAKYLTKNAEVIFFTKGYGMASTSFTNQADRTILASSVNENSSWIKGGNDNNFIKMEDGRLYLLKRIVFHGVENSPGGAIIFIPIKHLWITQLLVVLFILNFFCIATLITTRAHHEKIHAKQFLFTLSLLGAVILLLNIPYLRWYKGITLAKLHPYPIYNSTLRFLPEFGTFDERYTQKISAIIDSGSEHINAIKTIITYDPKNAQVEDIDTENSVCKHIIRLNHDTIKGEIEIQCIIPDPGYTGDNGLIANLYVKGKTSKGSFTIRYGKESAVYANDGLATNVLRTTTDTSLRFTNLADARNDSSKIIGYSPSHTNQERWYANSNVLISWYPEAELDIIHDGKKILDAHPDQDLPLRISIVEDGIHNIKLSTDTETDLTVRIDTTPPEYLSFSASATQIKKGGVVHFIASGSDSMSGLQRTFYLKINDELFYPVGTEVYVPFPERGKYLTTLRAYDNAGNYTDKSILITVK